MRVAQALRTNHDAFSEEMRMLIAVDPQSGVPVYRQLMDQIKFHVASGLVAPGDELPSTRALSSELGLNPMTVSKAYSYLEKEGVVERRPGRPLIVAALGSAKLEEQKRETLIRSLAKIATMVTRRDDLVNLLSLHRKPGRKVILGMGELGRFSRVAGPYLGSEFTFAAPRGGEPTAPGQLDASELLSVYKVIDRS